MKYHIICAHEIGGGIGMDGKIPWNLPSDLKRFHCITTSKPLNNNKNKQLFEERLLPLSSCSTSISTIKDNFNNGSSSSSSSEKNHHETKNALVMGRKTWDSLPRKPLKGRLNIIISTSPVIVFGNDQKQPDEEQQQDEEEYLSYITVYSWNELENLLKQLRQESNHHPSSLPAERNSCSAENSKERNSCSAENSKERNSCSAENSKERNSCSAENSKERNSCSAENSKERNSCSAENTEKDSSLQVEKDSSSSAGNTEKDSSSSAGNTKKESSGERINQSDFQIETTTITKNTTKKKIPQIDNVFFIGGESVFNFAMQTYPIDTFFITEILGRFSCDTFFVRNNHYSSSANADCSSSSSLIGNDEEENEDANEEENSLFTKTRGSKRNPDEEHSSAAAARGANFFIEQLQNDYFNESIYRLDTRVSSVHLDSDPPHRFRVWKKRNGDDDDDDNKLEWEAKHETCRSSSSGESRKHEMMMGKSKNETSGDESTKHETCSSNSGESRKHETNDKSSIQNKEEEQYLTLLNEIITRGDVRKDRTGVGTISLFEGKQLTFNLKNQSFPLLTTKRVFFRAVAAELLFFLRGQTDAKILQDQGIHIWDGNSSREFLDRIGLKDRKEGDLGPIYGYQWRKWNAPYHQKPSSVVVASQYHHPHYFSSSSSPQIYFPFSSCSFPSSSQSSSSASSYSIPSHSSSYSSNSFRPYSSASSTTTTTTTVDFSRYRSKREGIDQIDQILRLIRNDPTSRRMILTAWNPEQIDQMALPPCHVMYQFFVDPKRRTLSCSMTQRSADCFLGLPFNIASVALLTILMAKTSGLLPAKIIITIGDAHVYLSHLAAIHEQLQRRPFSFPTLEIGVKRKKLEDYQIEDLHLLNYQSWEKIVAPMAC